MKVYLAATYSKFPIMQQITTKLMKEGFEVTSRWIQGLEGITDMERAMQDLQDVLAADIVMFFSGKNDGIEHKSKGGRHTEFGIALASGKRIILVGERENVFHHLPGIEVVGSIEDGINRLKQLPEIDKGVVESMG